MLVADGERCTVILRLLPDNDCDVIAVEFVSCDRDGEGKGDGATASGEAAQRDWARDLCKRISEKWVQIWTFAKRTEFTSSSTRLYNNSS